MTGQVTAPLLQASSLCPLSCARANRRLSRTLLPAYERLLSSSGLSIQPSSINSTQFDLKSAFHRHQTCCPPLVPAALDKLLVFAIFPLCSFFTALLPRYRQLHQDDLLSPGDNIMMSGLRVVDSNTSGKWSFLQRSTSISHPWADCRRFCLTWLGTTGLWPSFTKAMVLSSGLALAGCFFLFSCSRMSASTAYTVMAPPVSPLCQCNLTP